MVSDKMEIQKKIQNIFHRAEGGFEASPYLETKILALFRERTRSKKTLSFWRRFAIGTSVLGALLGVGISLFVAKTSLPEAFVGEPFAIRLEVRDLKKYKIAKAQIRLPAGVQFHLEDFPDLTDKTEVTLSWKNEEATQFVPFILKSDEEGIRTLTVVFFDDRNEVVAEKKLSIRLRPAARS